MALLILLLAPLVGYPIAVVAIGLILYGICSTPLTIRAQTLRMKIIPAAMHGRAFALLRMLMQSGRPIGGALAGVLLPILGIPTMIAFSAILTGLPGLIGYQIDALRLADGKK